jgi:hypothetical protein
MFLQMLAAAFGLSGAGSFVWLVFFVVDWTEPNKNNCGPSGTHYTLAVENGREMRRPLSATFIQVPYGMGRYSDEKTTCRLLLEIDRSAGTTVYTNSEHSLEVTVGPREALGVVYINDNGTITRRTAPTH